MMKQNNVLRRLFAALLALLTLVSFTALPALAVEDDAADAEAVKPAEASAPQTEDAEAETISIATAEDLLALAESCTLDAWSREKLVVLEADLDLTELTFSPIATFGGTFDGQGHTIRGLAITDALSPAGLICTLQPTGRVENLHIEGSVAPAGDPVSTGGLVGENYGTIENCSFTGTVSGGWATGGLVGENKASGVLRGCRTGGTVDGENRTGGLAGCNLGVIEDCENAAYVNIESVDPGIDLSDLDLTFSLDLTKLSELSTANIATDTGGIAGYNAGTLSACRNTTAIGYPHIGYNVGGVAGRSCGQLISCVNTGAISGRKDVGGVVGQVEPYIEMQLDEKSTAKLQKQLDELSTLVDQAASDAQGGAGGVSSRINALSGYVDTAVAEAENVRVNVNGSANVTGTGSANSSTTATPSDSTIDSTSGSLGNIDVTPNEDGGVSIGVSTGDGTVTVNPGQVQIDHTGVANGRLDANGGLVAAPDLGNLSSAVSGVSSQISLLSDSLSGTVGALSNDVKAINKKFNQISNTLFDAVNDAEDGVKNAVTDASSVDVDKITLGKVSLCRNEAAVSGDINTGGVAGSMALEYALDPEDDVSSDLSGAYQRQYTYRAVLQSCTNTGAVTGKRSYVGGICGRMDLGLITACEGYGVLSSDSGSYVGGITGLTAATVQNSFAKATLSGKTYVGGITGSGIAEALDGSGSTVAGCVSLVEIPACDQYSGAIAGSTDGTYTENRFVSDTLAGLNRQSVSGAAEPVDFEALAEEETLPAAMRTFTLKFVAGDKTLKQLSFSYGDSFGSDIFPSIPTEDGSYAAWDRTDLSDLRFDTTVTAVYTPYTPSLASETKRDDGRAVLLAEGNYSEGDTISITAEPLSPTAFHVRTGNAANRLQAYFESFEPGHLPPMTANWDVVEQWSIAVSSSAPAPYRVRYLAPEGKSDRLRIYVEQDGLWQSIPYETIGSYLAFDIPAATARVAVISTMPVWWIWVSIPLLLALFVFLLVHFIRKGIRKAKRRQSAQPEPQDAPLVAAGVNGAHPQSVPQSSAASPAPETADLLARAQSAEEKLAELEAELAALKSQQASAKPDNPPENPNLSAENAPQNPSTEAPACPKAEAAVPAAKPKRRFRWWIPLSALVLLSAAAFLIFRFSKAKSGLDAYKILKNYTNQAEFAIDASLDFCVNGVFAETDVAIISTKSGDQRITQLSADDLTLYCANHTLYLEDGTAFSFSAPALTDYGALLDLSLSLYESSKLVESKNQDETVYQIALTAENAEELATILLPSYAAETLSISQADAELHAADGSLRLLRFDLKTSNSPDISCALTLTPRAAVPASVDIPESVLSAINSGESSEKIEFSEDFFRLISAWQTLLSEERSSYDLRLAANCGPILLDTAFSLDFDKSSGQQYGSIQKGSLTLYFSGDKICDSSGNILNSETNSLVDSATLLPLADQFVRSIEATCTHNGDSSTYTLSLDEDGMAAVAQAIAPESKTLDIQFSSGSLEMELTGNNLTQITLSCSGTLHVVLADAPVTFSAEITPAARSVSFPQEVINALKK